MEESMIDHSLDKQSSVLHVRPTGPLQKQDFDDIARTVDLFIEETGGLVGLILETEHFPGWENLGATMRHLRFVRDHHKKIKRVAVVTNSPLGSVAEHIASHFVSAEIRHFAADQLNAAKTWVAEFDTD